MLCTCEHLYNLGSKYNDVCNNTFSAHADEPERTLTFF